MNFYRIILSTLYFLRFRKTAVRIAIRWANNSKSYRRWTSAYCFESKYSERVFPQICAYDYCWINFRRVVDPKHPHRGCEEEMRQEDEQMQADIEAAWAEFHSWQADQDPFAELEQGAVYDRLEDDVFFTNVLEDDICDGICGQLVYACTCVETEALRRHNADPATRGSWFVT